MYLRRLLGGVSRRGANHGHLFALPEGVVAAGYLRILATGRSTSAAKLAKSWKKRYFVLNSDGHLFYFKRGRNGVGSAPKGALLFNGEYFVADSLLRRHGFQISDLMSITIYLSAASSTEGKPSSAPPEGPAPGTSQTGDRSTGLLWTLLQRLS